MSNVEIEFSRQCIALAIQQPDREHRFAVSRRWRFDFAWPDRMLALEIEGGVWTAGRHTRASGYIADMEKYSAAALLGWTVLRCSARHVRIGMAAEIVRRFLAGDRAGAASVLLEQASPAGEAWRRGAIAGTEVWT